MAYSKGFAGRCGIAKNTKTTWADIITTPEDPTDLVPLLSETMIDDYERIKNEQLYGGAGELEDAQGVQPITGDIQVEVHYDTKATSGETVRYWGTDIWFALAMGSVAFDNTNSYNKLTLADTLDDLSGAPVAATFAINKQVSTTPWQFNGVYLKGFTLTGNAKENIKATFPCIAYDCDRTAGATTETELNTLYDTVSVAPPKKVLFSDLVFRIGDDTDALGDADKLGINSFTFTFDRVLTDPEFSTPDYGTHTSPRNTIEPVVNGLRVVTLSITLPRYKADSFFTWRDNDEKLQCDLIFTESSGDTIKNFNLLIPTLKVTSVSAPISGSGVVPVTVNFKVFLKHPDNTFMKFTDTTAITKEFAIEVRNKQNGRTAVIWS
jgi:hypothetical protein